MDWKDIGEQQTDSQIASVFWLVFVQRYVMDCSYMEGKFRIDLGIGIENGNTFIANVPWPPNACIKNRNTFKTTLNRVICHNEQDFSDLENWRIALV